MRCAAGDTLFEYGGFQGQFDIDNRVATEDEARRAQRWSS